MHYVFYVLLPTALPSVTSLEPCNSRTCTVPKTLQANVTFECVLNSPAMSGPIWEIARSSSQLPLKNHGLQIIFASNLLQNQGYLLKNPFQNYSTLDITKQARQEHTQIRVQCIEFAETENVASDDYYVFTYGKYNSATILYNYWDGYVATPTSGKI